MVILFFESAITNMGFVNISEGTKSSFLSEAKPNVKKDKARLNRIILTITKLS